MLPSLCGTTSHFVLISAMFLNHRCNMKFVQSTYKVLDEKAKDDNFMSSSSIQWMKRKVISMREKFGTRIGAPALEDDDDEIWSSSLNTIYDAFSFDRLSDKDFYPDDAQAPKFMNEVKSAARTATLYRSMLEVANGYACHWDQKGSVFNPKAWYKCSWRSRDWYREAVDHKCAGSLPIYKLVYGFIPGWGGNRLYIWEYFQGFGLHLTNFKNMFGSKLIIPLIKRTTINGKFMKKASDISITTKGKPVYMFVYNHSPMQSCPNTCAFFGFRTKL